MSVDVKVWDYFRRLRNVLSPFVSLAVSGMATCTPLAIRLHSNGSLCAYEAWSELDQDVITNTIIETLNARNIGALRNYIA